jgi:hypothetical protein
MMSVNLIYYCKKILSLAKRESSFFMSKNFSVVDKLVYSLHKWTSVLMNKKKVNFLNNTYYYDHRFGPLLFQNYFDEVALVLNKIEPKGNIIVLDIVAGIDDYETVPKRGFDHAVVEKISPSVVVGNFYWSDVGGFGALSKVAPKYRKGGNIVLANKHVELIDCDGLVVVDTSDALLICPRDSLEKLKGRVEKLDETLR